MEKLSNRILNCALLIGALFLCIYPFVGQGSASPAAAPVPSSLRVVIDAGHGGEDGGAAGDSGIAESRINLELALRLRDLFVFCGIQPQMIRETDTAVYSGDCKTIAQKKVSDLKNRARMVNDADAALMLSIHQNYFEQSKYRGAQVFFAKTEGSRALAETVQRSLRTCVDTSNRRQVKPAQGVYLMEHIECTGILIECGFLSNPEEERLLRDEGYQKKLAAAICGAVTEYLSEKENTNEI